MRSLTAGKRLKYPVSLTDRSDADSSGTYGSGALPLAFCAVALTAEDAPVFERKDRLHRRSIVWIQSVLPEN